MKRIIILVHGFFKSRSDMQYLEKGLIEAGYDVVSVSLPTTFASFNQCRQALHEQVYDLVCDADEVNYVAHSMGGLIVRSFIDSIQQSNISKCVFIATPHGGSKLAKYADCIPFYSRIFKPIKSLLPGSQQTLVNENKRFSIGCIAGCRADDILGRLLLPKNSDGRVEIDSAKPPDMDDFVSLPYGHARIHHQIETFNLVRVFLELGSFNIETS